MCAQERRKRDEQDQSQLIYRARSLLGGGAGVQHPIPVTIKNYQVVLEAEAENPEDEEDRFEAIFSIELPPWEISVTIPEEFTDLGDTFLSDAIRYLQSAMIDENHTVREAAAEWLTELAWQRE